jgi:hypothetical protein
MLPPATPQAIRRLLKRALTKEPRQRLAHIRDARLEIVDAQVETPGLPATGSTRTRIRLERAGWALVALLLLAGLAFSARRPAQGVDDTRVVRASIEAPRDTAFSLDGGGAGPVAVSPDGTQMVFKAADMLWLRPLDGLDARPLQGTEGTARNNRDAASLYRLYALTIAPRMASMMVI